MRFNKQELIALASQPSQKFDREGILVVKEKQEGFFRRAEISLERWFRLRGNLLFYLRGPEEWSEPLGVIVLEQFTVRVQPQDQEGHWPFQIVWDGGLCYKMAALLESERTGWLEAIMTASYETVRNNMLSLQKRVEQKKGPDPDMDISMWRIQKGLIFDVNEVPMCELSLSCDNLLCDAHGRPPSALVVVHVQMPTGNWIRYANTEIVEASSNPSFAKTISLRGSDGLNSDTTLRLSVYDVREFVSHTAIPMGFTKILLDTIQDTQRLRVALTTSENKTVGFLTLTSWSLEPSNSNPSPLRPNGPVSMEIPQKQLSHRRSHSLPPRLGVKIQIPAYEPNFKSNFVNVYQTTYRFHSGLGGDITVHEIMAESKLCFYLPQQMLGVFIQREKELLQEVICLGELGGQWKSRQMELLDTHLSLLKHYSHARQCLQTFQNDSNGRHFKESSRKVDSNLEFAPVNLHLQRMWVHNDTLNKSGFYDLITVGAFTAHNQKAGKNGGLIRLVQQMKEQDSKKSPISAGTRVQMACDAVQAIKHLRGEIVNIMRKLLALSKVKESTGMMPLAEALIVKTETLLHLWDSGLVEEALSFIETHKVSHPVSPIVIDKEVQRPQVLSPFKQLTEQLSKLDLKSPELEDFATPSTPHADPNAWPACDLAKTSSSVPNEFKTSSENTPKKVFHSQEELIPTDQMKFYNEQFKNEATAYAKLDQFQSLQFHADVDHSQSSPIDQPVDSEFNVNIKADKAEDRDNFALPSNYSVLVTNKCQRSLESVGKSGEIKNCESSLDESLVFQMSLEENGNHEQEIHKTDDDTNSDTIACNDPIAKQYLDVNAMTNSPSANYYQPSDEPEPWDLTQLNIEASVMCLVSKVKFLCGRCGSPAVRLRNQNSQQTINMARSFKKLKPPVGNDKNEGTQSCNLDSKLTKDNENLRSAGSIASDASNRTVDAVHKVIQKGNKFTDGLNLAEVSEWAGELRPPMRKLRQAMDGLLKSSRLAHAVLRLAGESAQSSRANAALQIRRDVCFSQALTSVTTGLHCWLWSTDQDVIVRLLRGGLGPLCGFEGLLSLYKNEKAMWGDMVVAIEDLQTVTFALTKSNHSTTSIPQVTGSRGSLTVLMPVSDSLYARFHSKEELQFTITAVFFNIGINEKATIAEKIGDISPQEQSNCDNYERLNVYSLMYKKLFPSNSSSMARGSRMKSLEEIMENLKTAVNKKTYKNVSVLQLAATATRLMNGVRMTSCKSAKDRTGMSCTLEQCNILTNEYHLADHEFNKALDCMRSEGCRRENTFKNTGTRKYAFNKLQMMALPVNYRPPAGTYGSGQT